MHHALTRAEVRLPAAVREPLARRAAGAARKALILSAESLRLQRAFDAASVPAMILKGAPLAMLAYGRLGLKEARDIDLLVPPRSVEEAVRLLVEHGYRCRLKDLDGRDIRAFVPRAKELEFDNPRSGIVVELHWQMVDSRRLLPGVGAEGPAQDIAIHDGAVRTLADAELFGYLCVHGTAHNWNRLKWLADLGALLSGRSEAEVAALYRATTAQGTARAAAVALMLCERLLDLQLCEELARTIRRDAVARWLEANALRGLAYKGGAAEPHQYSATWMRIAASRFLLVPGPGYALEQAGRTWNSPFDRLEMPLPERLGALYHVLRIPLWLVRHAKRLTGAGAGR